MAKRTSLVHIGKKELLQKATLYLERAKVLAPERVDIRERVFMVSLVSANRELARQSAIFLLRDRRSSGDTHGGEQVLEAFLKVFPDSTDMIDELWSLYADSANQERGVAFLMQMVDCAESTGALERAEFLLKRILREDPGNTAAQDRLLRIHERRGTRDKLARESLHLARSLAGQGKRTEAVVLYHKAADAAGEDWALLEQVAAGLCELDEKRAAYDLYLRLGRMGVESPEQRHRANDHLSHARDLFPAEEEPLELLASLHLARNDRQAAAGIYRELLDIARARGNREKEREAAARILDLNPGDARIQQAYVEVLFALGREGEAVQYLHTLAEPDAERPEPAVFASLLERGVKERPKDLVLWRAYVDSLAGQGRGAEGAEALVRSAQFLRVEGDVACAIELARLAAETAPESVKAREVLAMLLSQSGAGDEGLEVLLGLADSLRGRGQWDEATEVLERCLALSPEKAPIYQSLCEVAREQGREDIAARWEKRLAAEFEADGHGDRMLDWLSREVEKNPRRLDLSWRLLQLLSRGHEEERFDRGLVRHLDTLERLEPQRIPDELLRGLREFPSADGLYSWGLEWCERSPDPEIETQLRMERARQHVRTKQYGEARRHLDRIVSKNPSLVAARRLLCDVLEAAGEGDQGPALLQLARCLRDAGETAEAAAAYRRALSSLEEGGDVRLELIDMIAADGDPDDAVNECLAGAAQLRADGRDPEAAALYRKARSLDSENTQVLREESRLLENMGRVEEAAEAYRSLADLYLGKDLPERAIEALRRAKHLVPDDPDLISRLAALFEREGMLRAAAKELASLAEFYGRRHEEDLADRARQRLAELRGRIGDFVEGTHSEGSPRTARAADGGRDADDGTPAGTAGPLGHAEQCLREGRREDAVEAFRESARECLASGRPDQAAQALARAVSLGTPSLDLMEELAEAELARGNETAAQEMLQHLAESAQRDQDYDRAVAAYRRIAGSGAQSVAVQSGLAWCLSRMGRKQDASAEFLKTADMLVRKDLPEEAVDACRRAVSLDPASLAAREKLVALLRAAGRPEEAQEEEIAFAVESGRQGEPEAGLQVLRRLVDEDPSSIDVRASLIALYASMGQRDEEIRERKALAGIHIERGDRRKAIEEYGKAVELGDRDPMVQLFLAEEARRAGDRRHARDLYVSLADLYQSESVWSKAATCLVQAAQLFPQDAEVRMRLADVYGQDGMRDKAVAEYLRLAQEALKDDKPDEALSYFDRLQKIDPQNVRILSRIVDCHIERGHQREAASVGLQMARIYRERGILSKAVEILKRILEVFPGEARLLEELGEVYLQRQIKREAYNVFRRLAELFPDDARYRSRVASLENELPAELRRPAAHAPAPGPKQGRAQAAPHADPSVSASPAAPEKGPAPQRTGFGGPNAVRMGMMSRELQEAKQAIQKNRYLKAMDLLRQVLSGTSAVTDLDARLEAFALMGDCCLRVNNHREAIRVLMDALSTPGIAEIQTIEIRYLLGNALERDGQKDQAVLVYKKVHELDPNYRDIQSKILWTRALSGGRPRR